MSRLDEVSKNGRDFHLMRGEIPLDVGVEGGDEELMLSNQSRLKTEKEGKEEKNMSIKQRSNIAARQGENSTQALPTHREVHDEETDGEAELSGPHLLEESVC